MSSVSKQALLKLLLEEEGLEAKETGAIPRRSDPHAPAPLSFAQQRIWFLHQLTPDSPFFNLEASGPFAGPLELRALRRSLGEVVARHASLRTTFRVIDGQPWQVVAPALEPFLPVVDLHALPAARRAQEPRRLLAEESRRPFDLEAGPLLRTMLIRLTPEHHVLSLVLHHMVADGWSMDLFTRELRILYPALSAGRRPQLPELPIQYGDFAAWQRSSLAAELLEQQLDYWRRQLAGYEPLEILTDRRRPPTQDYRGAHYTALYPRRLGETLHELGRRQGATLFMTLLAAFQLLLGRYAGQDDVVVGTFVAHRHRPELEPLIGLFLNTLVLRTSLAGSPSFQELLERVKTVALGGYAHQDLPFEILVDDLRPPRDLSRNPIFQVTFQLNNVPTRELELIDDVVAALDAKRGTSIFDLAVMAVDTPQGLACDFEYSTRLFDRSTLVRMAQHYRILLEAAVGEPERPIAELSFISDAERRQVVDEINATARPRSWERGLVELFREQVRRRPKAVAVRCEGESMSYLELDRQASRWARHLRARELGEGAVVGICLERSLELVTALLGVVEAGAAWLPLDPTYPRERLAYMLKDSGATTLISTSKDLDGLPADGARVILLDRGMEDLPAEEPEPAGRPAPGDAAYVIYTSGSTGRPKGVVTEHRQILNRLAWMWEAYPWQPGEVACQKTPFGFVDSIWEIFGSLLQGVETVVIPDPVVRDPYRLVERLAESQVSRLWVIPSQLRALLETFPDLGARLPALKMWVASGEPLSADVSASFRRALPHAVLYNLYGTSEVWDATWGEPSEADERRGRIPIGGPIDNVEVYVLDGHGQPVPIGVPGELHVAGLGLARGYLGGARLTAEGFADLQIGGRKVRAYRTGDLARWRGDGQLEFLGRSDAQVKVRGFRVEPAEVELALERHPAVRRAAVLAREDAHRETRLVAWFVARGKAVPSRSELARFLRSSLPEPMVPAAFIAVDAIPMTASGKLDRRRLPQVAGKAARVETEFVAPRSDLEVKVAEIWRDLLGLDRVGVLDSFFDVGGHSLLATQVVSRLRTAFGTEIPVSRFFEQPTVGDLARLVEAGLASDTQGGATLTKLSRERYRVDAAELAAARLG